MTILTIYGDIYHVSSTINFDTIDGRHLALFEGFEVTEIHTLKEIKSNIKPISIESNSISAIS